MRNPEEAEAREERKSLERAEDEKRVKQERENSRQMKGKVEAEAHARK